MMRLTKGQARKLLANSAPKIASGPGPNFRLAVQIDVKAVPKARPRAWLSREEARLLYQQAPSFDDFWRRLKVHVTTPKRTKVFQEAVRRKVLANMNGATPYQYALKCKIVCGFPGPRGEFPLSPQIGDWDNIAKSVCDALNGTVFVDDRQIVSAETIKLFSDKPFVWVSFENAHIITSADFPDLGMELDHSCLDSGPHTAADGQGPIRNPQ